MMLLILLSNPSITGPLITGAFKKSGSNSFILQFGSAKIASLKSFPTLLELTSIPSTKLISLILYWLISGNIPMILSGFFL